MATRRTSDLSAQLGMRLSLNDKDMLNGLDQSAILEVTEVRDLKELYEVGKELGSGGFSVVKQGRCKKDGTKWALKLIKQSTYKKYSAGIDLEANLLNQIHYHGVVSLREVVVSSKYHTLVLELCAGGELFERIVNKEKYSEVDARGVARDMLLALQVLHKMNVVHRDLKPENFLFVSHAEDAHLKITDFGFATLVPPEGLKDPCGTPEYVAPEILRGESYATKVDMWSAGVILYILLCGFPPFYGETDEDVYEKIKSCKYEFLKPFWNPVSDEAKDLIRSLLELDPQKRLSADAALNHPWFHSSSHGADLRLSGAQDELSRYKCTLKFRKAVNAVVAMNKLRRLRNALQNSATSSAAI